MKLSNANIIALVKSGVLTITHHTLSDAHAYKVYKFRKVLSNAFSDLQKAESDLVSECDLEIAENGSLEGSAENRMKFSKMQSDLYNEEVSFDDVKALPYSEWKKLQDENSKNKIGNVERDVLMGFAESALEGLLWTEPEE